MRVTQSMPDGTKFERKSGMGTWLWPLMLALAISLAGCSHEDPASLIASAKEYIAKGDFNASTIQLKNALQKDPKNAEARYLLGLSLDPFAGRS